MPPYLYRLMQFLLRILLSLIVRVEVSGLENISPTGGLIITGNHLGRLDPFLVYSIVARQDIIMLVAEKYRSSGIARWLVKRVDGIFVDRFNADFHVLRVVLNRLKRGGALVMAPEGTRSTTGGLIKGRPGAAYLAAKSGLPVVPVAEWGGLDANIPRQLRHLRRAEVKIKVGQPFTLPPLDPRDRETTLQRGTDEIMCRIAVLLPPEYRGIYADHPRLKELLVEGEKGQGVEAGVVVEEGPLTTAQ